MRIDAPIRPVEIDDAAGIQRRVLLRRLRYGLELCGGAMPGVEHGRQIVVGTQCAVLYGAQLFWVERLARVELTRADAGLARIRRELRTSESEGILHVRRLDHVGHERQL